MLNINHSLEQKPVIFLAFANDRVHHDTYLRNLQEELRGIRNALDKAKQAELCEVVERSNATIDDIMNVFQDENYNDRIAIFHYGGHADCYRILLETYGGARSYAYKEGLVSFFARQNGLKFIFLNACSTEQHALELKQAGITAVIGTSQLIDDKVATKLAIRFYNGIANGFTLERAWREAEDYIKIQYGSSNFTAMYHWEYQQKHPDRFPWNIHFKRGAGEVKKWNLPDAANDPLFGMPSLPHTNKLPDKPFLFLHRYEKKHAEIFFGRSYYIRELYNRIIDKKSSPIILLYGQSGVGKSSLLEAGLLPRLEETHLIIYIRRNQEKGLLGTLNEKFLEVQKPFFKKVSGRRRQSSELEKKWKEIEAQTGKPLVLIVDQVEEVYTHSNKKLPNEFEDFTEALKTLFGSPSTYPGGKLILSYRKEYHPEIDKQLGINELDRIPLFLQSLNRQDIIEVVTGLTRTQRLNNKYNLKVEDQLPIIIADDLLEDKDSPIAPVLQIILTKMWDNSKKDEVSLFREFSIKLYQALRREGLLMEDFFEQQMEKLKKWDSDVVDSGLALDVLKFHTTPLSTACSRGIEEIRQTYPHSLDIIDDLVKQLKQLYLLTDTQHSKNQTSLAHDTLAPVIIKEYNDSDKPGQRAARILAARVEDFKKEENKIWLNKVDLKMVVKGRSGMRALDNDERKLLEKSRKRKARGELIKVASIFLIVFFAIFAAWKWNEASNNARIIKADYLASQAQSDVEIDPTAALLKAKKAQQLHKSDITTGAIYKIFRENNFYKIIARLTQDVESAGFSSDGQYITANFHDETTRSWDLEGKEITGFKAHNPEKTHEDFSSTIQYPPISSEGGTIRLLDEKGNKSQDFLGHEGRVCSYTFSPDGKYFLTGSEDKTARLWDLQGNPLQVLKGHQDAVTSVAFSPDGRYILTTSRDKTLRLWKWKDKELKCFMGHTDWVYSAVFSPGGSHILTGSKDGTLRLWDVKTGQSKIFKSHKSRVTSAAFLPDGKHILAGFEDGTVYILKLDGEKKRTFNGHTAEVISLAFSPDGQKILTGSHDKTACLWGLEGKELNTFKGHKHRVTSVAFSPEGSYILTGSYDRTARLWDLKGNELKVFIGHKYWVTAVAFWPDEKSILTGSGDKIVRWDMKGNELQVFKGHENVVRSIIFSPDGKYILTGSFDKTARLWDLKGNQLQVFKGHEGVVHSAAFSPDGKNVLTGSFDGTARLWKIYRVEDFLKTGVCEKLGEESLKTWSNEHGHL